MAAAKPLKTSYEIEIFPNAKFWHNDHCVTISHKGSIFGTGFPTRKAVKSHLNEILDEINAFVIENPNISSDNIEYIIEKSIQNE